MGIHTHTAGAAHEDKRVKFTHGSTGGGATKNGSTGGAITSDASGSNFNSLFKDSVENAVKTIPSLESGEHEYTNMQFINQPFNIARCCMFVY